MDALENKPKGWRKGQFVFNYISDKYDVARTLQFEMGIDCFYNDDEIDAFIDNAYNLVKK
jgi:hypothetical protein